MQATKTQVAVIGAGAFGGWTALQLRRRGARVTLLDAWGPGNSRSSSGGESRILRAAYGPDQPYTRMAARATQLWREHEQRWRIRLLYPAGVLWMVSEGDDQFERASLPFLEEAGIRYEELSPREMSRRWPQVNFEGVRWGMHEPEGGFLRARLACQAVVEGFLAEGGEFRQVAVLPNHLESGCRDGVLLSDGSRLIADRYIFACGPWLGKLFPETIGNLIRPTKQQVFFFGTPLGDDRFSEGKLPVWADHGQRFLYGMPAGDGRGFKIADDTQGPPFDPTEGERSVSAEALELAREFLGFRFPAMRHAPLVETRVCQYENTPDHHFIIDRHPNQESAWIVGGGSGHGFKHGPALGELVAELIREEREPDPSFRLARFRER
ncbi:MAG TPA: FAD-dependent oxidoreductase [Terriglobales bacterium]|nr:FAD-dependent oxidoreductase [Terriglobales bacterium]